VLERRVGTLDEPDRVIALRKRIGGVQDAQIHNPGAAIETYRSILDSEPSDRDALSALERLYLAGNQVPEYLNVLEAELDATNDKNEQIGIYDRMAAALVNLADDPLRATEVLEKILMLDKHRDVTYRQLEDLYVRLEKWTELVETYRNHIEVTQAPAGKIELLLAMGQTYEKQIQDIDRAIETYAEILEINPQHYDAAVTLARLQEQIEDWQSAIKTLGKLVELSKEPEMRVQHLTRMGQVYQQKLDQPDQSEFRLTQALEINPGYVPALISLAELYKNRRDWLKAARNLEAAVEYSTFKLEKTNLAAEAGFIYYEELDKKDKAVALFAKVSSSTRARQGRSRARTDLLRRRQLRRRRPDLRRADPQDGAARAQRAGPARSVPARRQGRPRARQLREGAQAVPQGLRPRLDQPRRARRHGRPAVREGGLGEGVQAVPDDPGPAPRDPELRGDGARLLPPRHDQEAAERAAQGAQLPREGARGATPTI
jgi:tetratricopeptide (TPR) repeat protein